MLASMAAEPARGAAIPDLPQPKVAYSATRVIEMEGKTLEQKVYHERGRERAEMAVQGMTGAIITRPDLGLAWVLLTRNMYIEASTADAAALPGGDPTDVEVVEFKAMEVEEVDGHYGRRFDVRIRTGDGSVEDGRMWLDANDIPVRMEAVVSIEGKRGEIVMRLRDLAVGDQPDHLFELPAGAQKMDFGGLGAFSTAGFPPTGDAAGAPKSPGSKQPGIEEQMGRAAKQGAIQGTADEVKHQTRRKVRKGLGRIFD
jgi:hypothetical protein